MHETARSVHEIKNANAINRACKPSSDPNPTMREIGRQIPPTVSVIENNSLAPHPLYNRVS